MKKQKISNSILHFSILTIKWKNEKQKKFFFSIYFDLKPGSKNRNQNFLIYFLFWNQKMNLKKFFRFSILVMKLKNEKWKNFKIRFAFKSKNELYFRCTDFRNFVFPFLIWNWSHQSLFWQVGSKIELKLPWNWIKVFKTFSAVV